MKDEKDIEMSNAVIEYLVHSLDGDWSYNDIREWGDIHKIQSKRFV